MKAGDLGCDFLWRSVFLVFFFFFESMPNNWIMHRNLLQGGINSSAEVRLVCLQVSETEIHSLFWSELSLNVGARISPWFSIGYV